MKDKNKNGCTVEEWYEMVEQVCDCTGLEWEDALEIMGKVVKGIAEHQRDGSGD